MDKSALEPPVDWRHYVFVFVLAFIAWMLLAGNLHAQELAAGALVAAVVTALSGRHLAVFTGIRFTPAALVHAAAFLLSFFRALIEANIDLARRVLTPSLPIRPDLVEIETTLTSPLGRLLLTSAITLTPGTLSVDVQGNRLTVHWVYCPPGLDMQAKAQAIAGGFERHLKGFLI